MAIKEGDFLTLDLARFPDELFKPDASGEDWRRFAKPCPVGGFSSGSLGETAPAPSNVLFERSVTYPIYMLLNAAPFLFPPVVYALVGFRGTMGFLTATAALHLFVAVWNPMKNMQSGQFIYTERNIQKYHSMRWVWPKSVHPPNLSGPKIFCAMPHGLAPVGIVGYPFWSKLLGDTFCRWACAPVLLKLPLISYFLKRVGMVPAAAPNIKKVIKDGMSVGIVLDGIAGMFQSSATVEKGYVKSRKGIVKIALTTGTPLVPVYCFGTTQLWRIVVDPFGILEKLSVRLNVSVTPFFGRPFGLLPFGPPYRTPILVALGEPIVVPKIEDPSKEVIDEYHAKLMDGFLNVFEQHKAAYGWSTKKLVLV